MANIALLILIVALVVAAANIMRKGERGNETDQL